MAVEEDHTGGSVAAQAAAEGATTQAGADTAPKETPLEKVTSHVENYPTGFKLVTVLLSIYLSVFLVALDRTIIATALPQITNHFQSFGDVGWVSTHCHQNIRNT